ncbi:hypothetical protein L873DRAFT_1511026 [Choiromyces venosus 120613-1]|uniref:Uncharacterized protein n=1 Tax=Choiromyces venosus 120613-1 TaxID=1336337 RepID=A0A3N4J8Z0_9PEZI|nr:hypothetical protein L873DRAFT_1511026 [Choiromyces venosus 120613-1]
MNKVTSLLNACIEGIMVIVMVTLSVPWHGDSFQRLKAGRWRNQIMPVIFFFRRAVDLLVMDWVVVRPFVLSALFQSLAGLTSSFLPAFLPVLGAFCRIAHSTHFTRPISSKRGVELHFAIRYREVVSKLAKTSQ